jgi:hypothetical protein
VVGVAAEEMLGLLGAVVAPEVQALLALLATPDPLEPL